MMGGKGNDILIAGGGQLEVLNGGLGNDRYTGKGGCDYFFTGPGQGRDVVTDFDAVGNGDFYSQDYFTTAGGTYTIRDRGRDVVIDFGGGDKLILLDVKFSDVTSADFNI